MFNASFFFTKECYPEEIFANQKVFEKFICNIGSGVYHVPIMNNCARFFAKNVSITNKKIKIFAQRVIPQSQKLSPA